jgi:hypothetical protein
MRTITLLTFLMLAATASAQSPANSPLTTNDLWSRGTTLQLFGGAASASSSTTGMLGASFGWELDHRFEIEGAGAWLLEQESKGEGFAADMRLLFNVMGPSKLVPYVGGGMGLYRATFNVNAGTLPAFYDRHDDATPGSLASYTDPTAVFVGGAHLYLARHVSIRPEVSLRMALDHGDTYNVSAFTCAFVYHFEDHAKE